MLTCNVGDSSYCWVFTSWLSSLTVQAGVEELTAGWRLRNIPHCFALYATADCSNPASCIPNCYLLRLIYSSLNLHWLLHSQWKCTCLIHLSLLSSHGEVQQWLLTITSKWFYQLRGCSVVNVDFPILLIICTIDIIDWHWNWVIWTWDGIDLLLHEIIHIAVDSEDEY